MRTREKLFPPSSSDIHRLVKYLTRFAITWNRSVMSEARGELVNVKNFFSQFTQFVFSKNVWFATFRNLMLIDTACIYTHACLLILWESINTSFSRLKRSRSISTDRTLLIATITGFVCLFVLRKVPNSRNLLSYLVTANRRFRPRGRLTRCAVPTSIISSSGKRYVRSPFQRNIIESCLGGSHVCM